jgi:hypothetical protein
MVKGNADRRRELARLRCEEQRAELERRALGPEYATPAEARARFLSDAKAKGSDESDLIGWVITASEDGDCSRSKSVCESYFRTGACPLKRCKHGHETTISSRIGVPSTRSPESSSHLNLGGPAAFDVTQGYLPALQPLPLRTCDAGGKMVYDRTVRRAVRQPQVLMFIEWEGQLVFDFANPKVYAKYCERNEVAPAATIQQEPSDLPPEGGSTSVAAPLSDVACGASQTSQVTSYDPSAGSVNLVHMNDSSHPLHALSVEDEGICGNA